jgi:genome maintenance exonuclease 1
MFKSIKPILDESIIPIALEAPLVSRELKLAGRVDCVGLWENQLAIIDFKTSSKYKEEYMAKPWYLQMTAYAIMVEELTGQEIEVCVALVALENAAFQLFITEPSQHVEALYELRQRYRNLYGV